ncbi:hypothetical protein SAMN05444279_1652 [Ruegeria intermedia]|uniref:Uncharacterized protein n=1 Tax=Ruegeria intermedia TaxID=996115 RepID=A0A1M5C057_9RHOB|nr:hypothetical protein [Ruegeria intermedia]SHF48128.1 hypothetical protein SAMN05444279_1652 [Ruegeria intermedia]
MATRDQLYAKFGITAEAAQLFEVALGTVVLASKGHNNNWYNEQDPKAAAKALEIIESSTLGRVLEMLKHELHFEDDLIISQFKRGLVARNRLFHGFFERHNFKIQSEEGRDDMVAELEELHEELFRCWRVAEGLANTLAEGLIAEE